MPLSDDVLTKVSFNDAGLVCVVVQDDSDNAVLMVAWMNAEALEATITTGRAVYWSRSRKELWRKGDTSGNVQHVRALSVDCDGDALLLRVIQQGPACHTGTRTCFEAGGPLAVTQGGVS